MRLLASSYRWGLEFLEGDATWRDLCGRLAAIARQDVLRAQAEFIADWLDPSTARSNCPAGGQHALNRVVERQLDGTAWAGQERVLGATPTTPRWTIDFLADQLGLEVAFNNAGAIPQNLLRLTVRAESSEVPPEKRIRVGILVLATESLKNWSSMDGSVQTFERLNQVWLPHMSSSLPAPLVILGLDPADFALVQPVELRPPPPQRAGATVSHVPTGVEWAPTDVFPGEKLRHSELTPADRADWEQRAQAHAP